MICCLQTTFFAYNVFLIIGFLYNTPQSLMTYRSIFVILVAHLLSISLSIDCNATHFEFFSNFSLGKQQQLNKTFDQIQPKISVPTLSYKANDFATYNITNIKVKFRYLDSRQKSVIIGKDTIGIYGGKLQVTASFDWLKQTMIAVENGTGIARIQSQEIMFQKLLQIDQGYLDYKLAFYYNISFEFTNFSLVRIDPATTSDNDTKNILIALNENNQSLSLKEAVQKQIGYYYPTYLNKNLNNEHYPLDDHFEYSWQNPWSKTNITIPFMLFPTGVDLEQAGLSLTFVSYIKDYANWKCGKMIPTQELNPKIYGGLQQFISFSVFSNTIRYAFQKGFLDTVLNRVNWESRFFQFFAGDLYDVIPEVGNKFLATQSVRGNCTYLPGQQIVVKKHNNTVINTTTFHNCMASISSSKIAQFELKLNLQTQILSNQTHLNFKIVHADGSPLFKNVTGFQLKNKALAEHMVLHSLNRLKQGYTFGSGWKIYPRDYSHVLLEDDFIVIYDSTHVDIAQQ